MSAGFAETLALALFLGCLWHAWNHEGRAFAQQWFFTGYIFALVRENLFASVASFQPFVPLIDYAPGVIRFGSAPAALALYFASFTYIAYWIARALTPLEKFWSRAWRLSLITAAVTLPLEFVATSLGWWTYPLDAPYQWLGNLPYFVPFAWSLSALFFYFVIWRVRQIPFRGNGQLFALMTVSPIIGVLAFPVHIVPEFLIGWFALNDWIVLIDALLAALLIGLPIISLLGIKSFR